CSSGSCQSIADVCYGSDWLPGTNLLPFAINRSSVAPENDSRDYDHRDCAPINGLPRRTLKIKRYKRIKKDGQNTKNPYPCDSLHLKCDKSRIRECRAANPTKHCVEVFSLAIIAAPMTVIARSSP